MAVQRKRQAPWICSRMNSRAAFIRSEDRLRHDQHVAGLQGHVLTDVAAVDEVRELHMDSGLLAVLHAHDTRAVAGGKLSQTAHRQDRIQHRHSFAIRQGLGVHDLAHDLTRLKALAAMVTMMLTFGERTYSASTPSMSRASCGGVLPTATMFSTSGVEILPSGRTGTGTDSSGLRHTNTSRASPGPMM